MQSCESIAVAREASERAPHCTPEHPTGENRLNDNCLTDRQSLAVELIALGKSFTDVAGKLEINRKTLYDWRQDPEFQAALTARRAELWSGASDRVRGLLDESIDVIEQQLRDRYDRARFRAAATLLRLAGLNKSINPNNQ